MDEVFEVEGNGANKDDLLKEEGLHDVNEQLKGLAWSMESLKSASGNARQGMPGRGCQSEFRLERRCKG